jgi:hypothetical protein
MLEIQAQLDTYIYIHTHAHITKAQLRPARERSQQGDQGKQSTLVAMQYSHMKRHMARTAVRNCCPLLPMGVQIPGVVCLLNRQTQMH